jgi:hypothetical protein
MLLCSILAGWVLLEETHPNMTPQRRLEDKAYTSDETPLMATADAIKHPAVDLRAETYGTFTESHSAPTYRQSPQQIFTPRVRALIIALAIFTYHSMTYDHLLPIFFEDSRPTTITDVLTIMKSSVSGGLGLTLRAVGMIMSVNGVIALFIQAFIFPPAASAMGVHRLFLLVTILHPIAYAIVPYLAYLPADSTILYVGIYSCLTIRNLLAIIAYPLLLIMIKESVPTDSSGSVSAGLGKVNGAAASIGAVARMIAPPVAGWLYTCGERLGWAGLAWWGSAFVAVIGSVQCFWIERQKNVVEEEWKSQVLVDVTEVSADEADEWFDDRDLSL